MLRRVGNKANLIILVSITVLTTLFTPIKASNAAEELRQQFANGQSSAVAYMDNIEDAYDVIKEMISIDTDSPYDGDMIVSRGTALTYKRYDSGKIVIEQINPIDYEEADKLLDTMEQEIRDNLSEDATQKQTLNQIIKYIGKTYKYDFLARTDAGDNNNFVDAYHDDKKIICTQYTALTYLLCDRFGIDCKILGGRDHRYNAIRLDGEDSYTAYDLTKTSLFLPAKVGYVDLITTHYTMAFETNKLNMAIGTALNEKTDYHFSITIEEIIVVAIIITIIVLATKGGKHKNRKSRKATKR